MRERNDFGYDEKDGTYRYGDNTVYRLTPRGQKEIEDYIRELEAKRKEILDAKKDTADETKLPTVEEVFIDAMEMEETFSGNTLSEGEVVGNGWGVTDEYEADRPVTLVIGEDIEVVEERTLEKKPERE
jgi:hypothetical protein